MVVKIFASIGFIATFIVGISLLVFIEDLIERVEDLIESAVNNRKYKKQLKSRFEDATPLDYDEAKRREEIEKGK